MIPLFKSNFSIGKSILTLSDDLDNQDEQSSDSILRIAKENNLKQVVLVEDTMIGFLEAFKKFSKLNIHLIFGLRINCCNDVADENKDQSSHKIIIFAKNDNGCKLLNKIFSTAHCEHEGYVDLKLIASLWSEADLKMAIPFYDSYIYNNAFSFNNCLPNFTFTNPEYFVEENGLPFDSLIKEMILKINANPTLAKTILYKRKEDVFAFQAYKCLTNRSFGKERSLSNPNLNHFGSDEFCWESFLQVNS